MLSFLPLQRNSMTIGLNFLLASVYPIVSSNTINNLCFFVDYILLKFHSLLKFDIIICLFVNNQ